MRGVDVPDDELDKAEEFFVLTQHCEIPEVFAISRTDFLRFLAWYGVVRRDGDGSGMFFIKSAVSPETTNVDENK